MPTQTTEARLDREGATIAYEVVGPDQPGAAPAVVLLHNIFCDRRIWDATVARLRPRFRVVALDLRGHGASSVPARPYRNADLVADVVAVMDRERIERAAIVGLSIGATVALELVLAHPARVDRLVLMGADAAPDGGLAALRNALFCVLVRLLGMRLFLLDTVAKTLTGATFRRDRSAYQAFRARLARFSGRAAAYAMKAWTGRRPLAAAVAAISVPTLVVVGDEDVSCPLPSGERLAAAVPAATLTRIAGAGHTMAAEQPHAVATTLAGFL